MILLSNIGELREHTHGKQQQIVKINGIVFNHSLLVDLIYLSDLLIIRLGIFVLHDFIEEFFCVFEIVFDGRNFALNDGGIKNRIVEFKIFDDVANESARIGNIVNDERTIAESGCLNVHPKNARAKRMEGAQPDLSSRIAD